ncbi:MAG: SAM-dependent methyltransferase [Rhizobiales bacterium]|nr:SAM-dependent methyltransferase [Hyphomicrobiales bacterium]
MTPLEKLLRQMIEQEGPMRLDRYMGLCLGHPQYGYYMTRDPFGETGDFVTAPEISQMFGELIGIWCATQWQAMGSPKKFNLIELGPGRGTLMADALRAGKVMPGFVPAAHVHLVETSPVLRRMQKERLGAAVAWHDSLAEVPAGAAIIIANEFFDAIPIRQFEWRQGHCFERCVGLGEGGLTIGLAPVKDICAIEAAEETLVIEEAGARNAIAAEIAARINTAPGAALIIDYGHVRSAPGDTLQAVRQHRFVDVLDRPGEADLTAHVDFEALSRALSAGGASVHGPITQGEFLRAMGIAERARALGARSGAAAEEARERLAGEAQMGNLFKVLAATSQDLAVPYPFVQA